MNLGTAAKVKVAAKGGDVGDCSDLATASIDVSDAVTTAGLFNESDPLITSLLQAASTYQNAATTCDYPGQEDAIVRSINEGDAAIAKAGKRAKQLGTRL